MEFKDTFFSRNLSINCRGKLLDLSTPGILGILNLTPDSFYDGGRHNSGAAMEKRIHQIVLEGADIIDIGGFSSRPGAKEVSVETELERLIPAMEIIRRSYPDLPVSVDTFRLKVARKLHADYGIDIINDITSGDADPELISFAAENRIAYIAMHMQGSPENMQKNPDYKDVVDDLLDYFDKKIRKLQDSGIKDIIIDPGFGFGKSPEHNYQLLSGLESFRCFEVPVLCGISRKSMIYKSLNINPEDALNGSTALHMYSLVKGANLLRVHDIKQAKEVVSLYEKLFKAENEN